MLGNKFPLARSLPRWATESEIFIIQSSVRCHKYPTQELLPFPFLKSEREFQENYAMLVEIKLNTSRRGRANMEKKFFIQFHSCWCGRHQVVISPFRIQSIYFT